MAVETLLTALYAITTRSTDVPIRRRSRQGEAGYSTEAVIITSLLVALAIAAVGIIAAKVLTTANGIQTQ